MPRREKGILGVPRDGKNQMLFSFSVRKGEEWGSDSSDSDYIPSDKDSLPASNSKKPIKQHRKRKSSGFQGESDSETENSEQPKSNTKKKTSSEKKKPSTSKEKRKKKTNENEERTVSNSINSKLLDTGGERYKDVWGKKIPPEILLKIFQCVVLVDGGALPFLKRAARTCRLWWEVSRSPNLWDTVDMSYGWIKSTDATLRYLCPDRFKCLKEIRLNGWKNLSSSGLQAIADNCPELENINLSGCSKVNSAGLKTLIDKCPCLHTLDLSSTSTDAVCSHSLKYLVEKAGSRLLSISVGCNTLKGFNNSLNCIMENCPNLQCLDASNARFTSDFFSLNVERFQEGCPKLRILRFANTRLRGSNASNAVKERSPGFPDLQELSLAVGTRASPILGAGGVGINDDFLHRILKSSFSLKLLDLRSCCSVTHRGIQNLPITDLQQFYISQSSVARYEEGIQLVMQKWQHSLVELDLSWNIYPGASLGTAMNKIASNPQDSKLQVLNLSGTSISFHQVKSILQGCPRLKTLNLQSCRGLPRGMKKDFEGKSLDQLRIDITSNNHFDRK